LCSYNARNLSVDGLNSPSEPFPSRRNVSEVTGGALVEWQDASGKILRKHRVCPCDAIISPAPLEHSGEPVQYLRLTERCGKQIGFRDPVNPIKLAV
jgi:hypothetical protein